MKRIGYVFEQVLDFPALPGTPYLIMLSLAFGTGFSFAEKAAELGFKAFDEIAPP